eukprot:TRINITY_DN1996_c1_g1_i7.p1 TRINITY_DN1996_c1_g1~~TRINITY_DN1996_c1_g1_i7.p1  ORF type:complete len:322 (-),score=-9.50 TRINITY_DN1996_c1_g1_i7:232-1155(-)
MLPLRLLLLFVASTCACRPSPSFDDELCCPTSEWESPSKQVWQHCSSCKPGFRLCRIRLSLYHTVDVGCYDPKSSSCCPGGGGAGVPSLFKTAGGMICAGRGRCPAAAYEKRAAYEPLYWPEKLHCEPTNSTLPPRDECDFSVFTQPPPPAEACDPSIWPDRPGTIGIGCFCRSKGSNRNYCYDIGGGRSNSVFASYEDAKNFYIDGDGMCSMTNGNLYGGKCDLIGFCNIYAPEGRQQCCRSRCIGECPYWAVDKCDDPPSDEPEPKPDPCLYGPYEDNEPRSNAANFVKSCFGVLLAVFTFFVYV